MNWETVTFVRIYLTEADKTLEPLLKKLHDQEKVRGVTVFRAMSGFGGSGVIHTASLLDLSLDLPVAYRLGLWIAPCLYLLATWVILRARPITLPRTDKSSAAGAQRPPDVPPDRPAPGFRTGGRRLSAARRDVPARRHAYPG